MPKTGKKPAERKFAARIAFRNSGKKQQDIAPPRKVSFFSAPPPVVESAEPSQHVAEVAGASDEYNYFFETPAGDTYAVVGTVNAPKYNWTAWFLGCAMNLTDPGIIGDPFWYACAPAIGSLCPVNDTKNLNGIFPPDLICLKSSCPPYLGDSGGGGGDISLPSFDPSILLEILAAAGALILVGCIIRRSYASRTVPPQLLPAAAPPAPPPLQIGIDEDDAPVQEGDERASCCCS